MDLKYRGVRILAEDLAALLIEAWPIGGFQAQALVAVPLHRARLSRRGYNQSELLARALGAQIHLPLIEGGLFRVRNTPPQVEQNGAARLANLSGAFSGERVRLEGVKILLIDDVLTTGATLNACAHAALDAGAASVEALTLAREL